VCCGGVGVCGDVANVIVESGEVAAKLSLGSWRNISSRETSLHGLDDACCAAAYGRPSPNILRAYWVLNSLGLGNLFCYGMKKASVNTEGSQPSGC